jgi:hypothetical protein
MNVKKIIEQGDNEQVSLWKGLNTFLLACISIGITLNLAFVVSISNTQKADGKEIVRIDTNQKAVMKNVETLELNQNIIKADIATLKLDWITAMKDWTEANYVRKPQ